MASQVSSITSDLIGPTAGTVVCGRQTRLSAVVAVSDGTNLCTVVVYDNASAASGKVLAKAVATAQCPTVSVVLANPVRTDNGITISVVGTGASAVIHYDS